MTCHRNFDPPRREWLPRFGTPRGIIDMRTWWTLHPRRILHGPGAISVHVGFPPGEPRFRALRYEVADSTDCATVTSIMEFSKNNLPLNF